VVDFSAISERALENLDQVTEWLNLDGEYQGDEFVAYNPTRADDSLGSFSISAKTGKWADFACDDASGGDVVSYVAYVKSCKQVAAARDLEAFLNTLDGDQTPPPAAGGQVATAPTRANPGRPVSEDALVSPIPANMPLPDIIPGFGRPDVAYSYKDSAGQDLFYVLRRQQGDSKVIRPCTLWQTPSGRTQWRLEGVPAPRPLYNLDRIAGQPTAPILIVEGEKAADAAHSLFPQGVVTTTPNGAQAVRQADLTPLKDRALVIWPDHDTPGERYARQIQESLAQMSHSGSVTVIQPASWCPTYDNQGVAVLAPQTSDREGGWDAADAVTEGWTAVHLELLLAQTPPKPGQPANSVAPLWAESYTVADGRFSVSDEGVVAHIPANGKVPGYEVPLSSRIDVTHQTRDEGSNNWGLLLRFGDPDGHVKEWAMPGEMLAGDGTDYRSVLSSMGAVLEPTSKARGLLAEYFTAAQPSERALCTTTVGWHGNVFVLPKEAFGQNRERIILQSRNPTNVAAFEEKGTLAEWQQHVGGLCVGNSRLVLAICTALAGPLLKPLEEENGGFHLRGASSRGKTKALKVAASVWGSAGLMKTWRATSNGLEGVALQHNDTVLLLDELGQCRGHDAAEAVYMLANGEGRARATTSGAPRQASRWRLLFLSTGEVDLASHIATDGQTIRAGQEVRFLDVPADGGQNMGLFENLHGVPSPSEFATAIDERTNRYYGTLGPALLRHLTTDEGLESFRTTVIARRDAFVQSCVPAGADGQVGRAARRFGLLAGVGEAAIAAGLFPWPQGEAERAIRQCFEAWLQERGGAGAMEERRAIEQVRRILERDGDGRFDPLGSTEDVDMDGTQDVRNRLGFKKRDSKNRWEYWVLPEMYKDEFCHGFDQRLVTRVLADRGYLKVGNDGKSQVPKLLPNMGSKRVYVILPTIFADPEEH
jgi:uncharacterized protein (DUF927 family)